MKVTLVPTVGVVLDAVLLTARSADATGTGVLVEVLLPGVGSLVVDVAVAVFAYGPVGSTVATICRVALAPEASAPTAHTPVPAL
ncbi:hypothetical protein ASD86_23255 [Lysobacter sp. Root690]|nr:hypothetical protein ASD86_23255 [Lysobacter sp. Root690]